MRARVAAAGVGLVVLLAAAPAHATSIKWSPFGTMGANGWYISDVFINWTVSDFVAPITDDQCPRTVHLTADTSGVQVSCSITTAADGQVSAKTPPFKIDRTPPASVTAQPARPPDANGWYNHPLPVAWSGRDATSGIASCTAATYRGPDDGDAQLAGGCVDGAGNYSAAPFTLEYDADPPRLLDVTAIGRNHSVSVGWAASPDTTLVQVVRRPGRRGQRSSTIYSGTAGRLVDRAVRNGVTYRYAVRAQDEADNVTAKTVRAIPSPLIPPSGARLAHAPLLRWRSVNGASYYNVQLFRGKTKILSAWPAGSRLQLHRSWRYLGHRYTLVRGHYRWYVWPGFGPRSAHRYGGSIGRSSFSIVR
jgi:hypothetical protein